MASDSNDPSSKSPLPPSKKWRKRLHELRDDVTQWTQKTQTKLSALRSEDYKEWLKKLQNLELSTAVDWVQKKIQLQKASRWMTAGTIVLSTYFTADLTALLIARFIPEPASESALTGSFRYQPNAFQQAKIENYAVIFSRNLFNSKGLIPGDDADGAIDSGAAPVKTSLPLTLIGTVILEDELKSVATLEDRTASLVYPVRVDDEIPSKIRILKVEPKKVIFTNIATGRKEYVDLPDDSSDTAPRVSLGVSAPKATAGIEKTSGTQWTVPRGEVDKAFSNLNEVLTQARAVPNFKNGVPHGYKLFQVVPNSIYTKLGLQDNDTILGVDGETINDPAQALNKLSGIRTSNHLELQVERNGKTMTFTYDIN